DRTVLRDVGRDPGAGGVRGGRGRDVHGDGGRGGRGARAGGGRDLVHHEQGRRTQRRPARPPGRARQRKTRRRAAGRDTPGPHPTRIAAARSSSHFFFCCFFSSSSSAWMKIVGRRTTTQTLSLGAYASRNSSVLPSAATAEPVAPRSCSS